MGFNIQNRRYTGSKYKLKDWIIDLISQNCEGISFCDIFAGTGIISAGMLNKYNTVIINDFLYSNNIIYKAFFEQELYDITKLNKLVCEYKQNHIEENYVTLSYGNKFFSNNDASNIGYIRQNIEDIKNSLSEKEYNILLASLLYSLDKCANTVGHYDAYFKKNKLDDKFEFKLIEPIANQCNIQIYREDANNLVRKIESDIVYIDPPYNSRQYSRFYHVLENITQWEKPELFGAALKPLPENMSEYCRKQASEQFFDLIANLKCKYAVVSYNNTYDSKSSSSKNKISLDFIKTTLEKFGVVAIFEKPYQYFNAGKTSFANHKEYIFILKVGVL